VTLLPGPDEPVPVLLMNTVWADTKGVHDALTTTGEAEDWTATVGDRLPGMHPRRARYRYTKAELVRLRQLREALRDLAAELTGDPRPIASDRDVSQALARVNEASGEAPSWPQLGPSLREASAAVRPGTPPPAAALSAIAADAITLFVEAGTLLRACRAPGCVLYFVKDHPRREWCSASCGNRARAARHYDRHRRVGATS
jgi:predicted RNA-binding Zn ribbon-like protein